MFQEYFGLREQPFGVTPDPRYLYLGPAHREAMASLFYGIEANLGFLALIARPGMGKTTLLFHLLEKIKPVARTAFIFQTQCTSREFLRLLMAELGLDGGQGDFVRMHENFNRALIQEARAGRRFVVVVDEAQNLDDSVLETIRLLSDFETPQAKLMQIVLSGQPELAHKLASSSLSQLRQRISSVSGLEPLVPEQVHNLIRHRLRVAGHEGADLFEQDAVELIAHLSQGIPRNVNSLCFGALSITCAMREKIVTAEAVEEVALDLDVHKLVPCDLPAASRNDGLLSPAEARAYMKDVSKLLKDFRSDKGSPRRQPV
jgi:general secretion pathway protein A